MSLSPEHQKLYNAIDQILWKDWDPIQINDIAPVDEYQSYTPVIFTLKLKQADIETIANKFFEIETTTMGLVGDFERCKRTALKIIEL